MKTSKIYTIGVLISFFLTKNKRFHHINWISELKPQTAKGIFTLQFNYAEIPFTPSYLEPWDWLDWEIP